MAFVDQVRIHVRGGDGGAGVAAFQRLKGKPKGKPTGGNGGAGGDVVLEADPSASSLLAYARQPHHQAESGTHGAGDFRHGRHGDDLVLPVPLGTVVTDETGVVIADLVEPGQRVVMARGGRGGKGNAAFVSRARKAPGFAEQGEYGEEARIGLELKLLADAALIGFPNAGKSTLISRVSAAKPKIADYPFTTLEPNLGVVTVDDREFVLADIPGLIEGAAQGKGLGHEFLRHVERARVLVILLDPTPIQPVDHWEQLAVLQREIAEHAPELAERPQLIAVNKADAHSSIPSVLEEAAHRDLEVLAISAVTGTGLGALLYAIADAVDQDIRQAPEREGFVLHRPLRHTFEVQRDGEGWVVDGRIAERAVAFADLTDEEAAGLAARRLSRLGVDDALIAAGAVAGDDVRIGDLIFTFDPERAEETDRPEDDGSTSDSAEREAG